MPTKVKGLRELSRKLDELGPALGGKYLRSATMSATLPVVKTAQKFIPKNDRDYLHKTYKGRKVAPGFASRNIKRSSFLSKDKTFVRVRVGVSKEAFYAVQFVERGTSRQQRQRWLEPAFRANKAKMIAILRDKLRQKIFGVARKTR